MNFTSVECIEIENGYGRMFSALCEKNIDKETQHVTAAPESIPHFEMKCLCL
jgi:hypothetical protein